MAGATNDVFDFAVIGAGIVGLASARWLANDGHRVLVLEKESRVAAHQSSRNSGVLHTGVYYKPGSAKAVNCRAGYAMMVAFCQEEGLPHDLCGKVIVATDESELERLSGIEERGRANGVEVHRIDAKQLAEIEPHTAGIEALHVPEAGITAYGVVCERMAERLVEKGSEMRLGQRVVAAERADGVWRLRTPNETHSARVVVNCAGLHCDRVARLFGVDPGLKIVPFRGEYYVVAPEVEHLCRGLIYPVPDPQFPFLGVHFTRMIEGGVECGPNAVLALAREGYTWKKLSPRDLAESLTNPGFIRLASKHLPTGLGEVHRSLSRRAFAKALQRLVPDIRAEHLKKAPAGNRAQALEADGSLVDDFRIVRAPGMVHVVNAPSPAATASLAIGQRVHELAEGAFHEVGA